MKIGAFTGALVFLTVSLSTRCSDADLVVLNFLGVDASFDFETSSGMFTTTVSGEGIAGIKLTFSAIVAGNTGILNASGSNYGINATEAEDDPDELDGENGAETMRIEFEAPPHVTNMMLHSIAIGSFGTSDSGTLTIGANSSSVASGTSTTIPIHTNLDGQFLEVAYTAGNGFGFNGLTLDVAAVPEPAAMLSGGLICAVCGFAALARRLLG